MAFPSLPRRHRQRSEPDDAPALLETIEELISQVPVAHTHALSDPAAAAEQVARQAAHRAALLSGSLALPPGPLGLMTVLPDLYLIWKVQRQMVADIFALHGRTADLDASHMVYCLFRHLASHLVRDVAVRAGQRAMVGALALNAVQGTATAVGMHVTRRIAGASAGRWVPVLGAAAVGAYAYWDTLQVAKAARGLIDTLDASVQGAAGDLVTVPASIR